MAFLSNGVNIQQGLSGSGWAGYSSAPAGTINYISGNYYYHNTTQHAGGSAVGGYAIPLGVRKVTLTVHNWNLNTGSMDPWEVGLMITTGSSTQTSGYYGQHQLHDGNANTANNATPPASHVKYTSSTAIRVPWGQAGFATNLTMECRRMTAWTGIAPNLATETANARWNINYWGTTGAAGNAAGTNVYMFEGHFVQTALSGGSIRGFQLKTPNSVNTTFTFDSLSVHWDF